MQIMMSLGGVARRTANQSHCLANAGAEGVVSTEQKNAYPFGWWARPAGAPLLGTTNTENCW
jgi:hypothetical protein